MAPVSPAPRLVELIAMLTLEWDVAGWRGFQRRAIMNTALIVLGTYLAIGAALGSIGQIFAEQKYERSLGGFLIVMSLWPAFVVGMIMILFYDELGVPD